jgi:hypothetical protein
MLGQAWTLILIHGSIPDHYLHLITYQLYRAIYSSPVYFSQAVTISLRLSALTIGALFVQRPLLRARSFQMISGRTHPAHRVSLHCWKMLLCRPDNVKVYRDRPANVLPNILYETVTCGRSLAPIDQCYRTESTNFGFSRFQSTR